MAGSRLSKADMICKAQLKDISVKVVQSDELRSFVKRKVSESKKEEVREVEKSNAEDG